MAKKRGDLTAVCLVALVGAGMLAAQAAGDEIIFNNGDRLTGTIVSSDGTKLKIKTDIAGEISVDLSNVKTFTSEKPIAVWTKSGDKMNAPIAAGANPGEVTVQPAEGAATPLPLDQVKAFNFNENWTGALIAGAMFARGNTDADDINVAFELGRRREFDRATITGGYNFGREKSPDTGDKSTSSDNWFATGKYDYFLNEKLYVFGAIRYEHDRIADLDYRLAPSVGLGYQWIDQPTFKFDTEAGLAYVWEKFDDGEENENLSARLAYHVKKDLWDAKVKLFHNLEYYPSLEEGSDFLVVTDAGIRAALSDRMFTEYKFEWRYDATPADGKDKNDLRHIVGVGWKF